MRPLIDTIINYLLYHSQNVTPAQDPITYAIKPLDDVSARRIATGRTVNTALLNPTDGSPRSVAKSVNATPRDRLVHAIR